ncbi:MAG: hypothetical protein V3R76_10490 [Gammaproteobacteria bacterium]
MNPANSVSAGSTLTTYTEQAAAIQEVEQDNQTIGFFAVGVVINIVMITAYFIWAYRQWGKAGKRDR